MPLVEVASHNDVSIITLNRPEKRNSFNLALFNETISAIREACHRSRGIVFTGKKYFSAGLDLGEIYGFTTIDQSTQFFNALKELINTVVTCERPIVALVNDSAYGFAVELLYFMDRVIAVDSAKFSLPGVKYGIVPVTPAFAHILGLRAKAFLDPSFTMSAREAYDIGLVNEVVDSIDSALAAALNAVDRLSSIPNNAFKLFKNMIMGHMLMDIMPKENELLGELARYVLSDDAKNKLSEFVRRKSS